MMRRFYARARGLHDDKCVDRIDIPLWRRHAAPRTCLGGSPRSRTGVRTRSRASWPRRFGRSERGVAFVEFALIAPFLIAVFLGCFELTRYINTMRKLTYLANSTAEMLAQNTSGTVTDDDLHFSIDSTMVVFPDVLADSFAKKIAWWLDINVAMSSVAFTPTVNGCTSGCTYQATTAWASGATPRPCSVPLLPVADTAAPTPLTLPTDVYGPGSLIVVDVAYTYTPVVASQLASKLFGTMTIRRSAYIQPRYVPIVKYTPSYAPLGVACPGY